MTNSQKCKEVEINNQQFILNPDKCMFWKNERTLIVSDLHIGKAGHFRKSGIPVTAKVHEHDLQILRDLLINYHPEICLFLGDLFHSDYNEEWQQLFSLVQEFEGIRFVLVRGNHDLLNDEFYVQAGIDVCDEYQKHGLIFTHEPLESASADYNISGHIHPGVRLQASGRQSLTLPCFYFEEAHALMPSFGQFTGVHCIRPKKKSKVFAIANEQVFNV